MKELNGVVSTSQVEVAATNGLIVAKNGKKENNGEFFVLFFDLFSGFVSTKEVFACSNFYRYNCVNKLSLIGCMISSDNTTYICYIKLKRRVNFNLLFYNVF